MWFSHINYRNHRGMTLITHFADGFHSSSDNLIFKGTPLRCKNIPRSTYTLQAINTLPADREPIKVQQDKFG